MLRKTQQNKQKKPFKTPKQQKKPPKLHMQIIKKQQKNLKLYEATLNFFSINTAGILISFVTSFCGYN